jgi:hypothetical protein
VVRAMALNMGMLASNDQAKEMIEAAGFEKGGSAAVLGGATIAGVPGPPRRGGRWMGGGRPGEGGERDGGGAPECVCVGGGGGC